MRLSPIVCTCVILAASVAVVATVSSPDAPSTMSISLSPGTYTRLMAWGDEQDHQPGQTMTAGRAVDLLLARQQVDANTDSIQLQETNYVTRPHAPTVHPDQ